MPTQLLYATIPHMINVQVKRHGNENVGGLMRRFSRKMQSSGVVRRVRDLRYHKRNISETKKKKDALTRIEKTAKYIEMYKLGRNMNSGKKHR